MRGEDEVRLTGDRSPRRPVTPRSVERVEGVRLQAADSLPMIGLSRLPGLSRLDEDAEHHVHPGAGREERARR